MVSDNSPDQSTPLCISGYSWRLLLCWPGRGWRLRTALPIVLMKIQDPPSKSVSEYPEHTEFFQIDRRLTKTAIVINTFQSNGACQQTCADYALGVLQGKSCWCTNVAPSKESHGDTSDCSTGCPGYPADSCGSASKGMFAYVSIPGNSVTSTAHGSSTSVSCFFSFVVILCPTVSLDSRLGSLSYLLSCGSQRSFMGFGFNSWDREPLAVQLQN